MNLLACEFELCVESFCSYLDFGARCQHELDRNTLQFHTFSPVSLFSSLLHHLPCEEHCTKLFAYPSCRKRSSILGLSANMSLTATPYSNKIHVDSLNQDTSYIYSISNGSSNSIGKIAHYNSLTPYKLYAVLL